MKTLNVLSPESAHSVLAELREELVVACRTGHPVQLVGGKTHQFYGNPWLLTVPHDKAPVEIDCRRYHGVVHYDPSELVVTVRCGTPLDELEALLAEQGQCLPFEPPHFAPGGTVGGMIATGLSGPRRMSAGAVRDFILGTRLLTGSGEFMKFGGQVMKNVAGYDVSRLLVGSMGVLGLIAEVSLKVLPVPRVDQTLRFEMDEAEALRLCNAWGAQPLPVAATTWHEGILKVRLCGAARAVEVAARQLGGEALSAQEAALFWRGVRDHTHAFFMAGDGSLDQAAPLWRLSVPSCTPVLDLPGRQLIEWGGALRWYLPAPSLTGGHHEGDTAGTLNAARALRLKLAGLGGSATLFRADARHAAVPRLAELSGPSRQIHLRLKQAFDPAGLVNPGRLYDWM